MPQLPFTFRQAQKGDRASGEEQPSSPQPGTTKERPLSVSELNRALRRCLEAGLARVFVEGEVRGEKQHPRSGHVYFDLADRRSSVPVFLSASSASKLSFRLSEGLHVLLEAEASVFEPRGRLQLRALRVFPVGEGALRLALKARIEKLEQEGLTREDRKKPLPLRPRPIGVVTSRSGAALRDIVDTAFRRDPGAHLVLVHSAVQGVGSVGEILRALQRIDTAGCEAILLVRGGGSLEDLHAFNEEPVARAIARCVTPIVTGIGHESDTTLADLVADLRASTPTAAAERVVPERRTLEGHFVRLERRLGRALKGRITTSERDLGRLVHRLSPPAGRLHRAGQRLDDLGDRAEAAVRARLLLEERRLRVLEARLSGRRPKARLLGWRARLEALESRLRRACFARLEDARGGLEALDSRLRPAADRRLVTLRLAVDGLSGRLRPGFEGRLERLKRRFEAGSGRLEALSPLSVLRRGYAVVKRADGRVLRDPADVRDGDRVDIRVLGGTVGAVVRSSAPSEEAFDDEER